MAIDRSTMAGWVGRCERLLDPLVAALGHYALAASKLHAEDTPVSVLSPGRSWTKTGCLWMYVRDDRASASATRRRPVPVLADRKGEHPQAHLKDFKKSVLQADAYAGFVKLYAGGGIVEASRWAHARRPFWDLHESQGRVPGSVAEQALRRSVRCMRSRRTSEADHPMSAAGSVRLDQGRCWKNCSPGSVGCWGRCRSSRNSDVRSATRSQGAGC